MRRIFTLLFSIALVQSNAQNILAFDFATATGSPTTFNSTSNASGVQTSIISRGAGLTPAAGIGIFNSSSFGPSTSIANAITNNDYYQFTVTPTSGTEITISSITLKGFRSKGNGGGNQGGPASFVLRSSNDGYTTNLGNTYSLSDPNETINAQFVFASNITTTSAITFRIYGFNPENADGTFGIGLASGDDLTVQGSVKRPNTQADNFQPTPFNSGNPISGNVLENDTDPYGGTLTVVKGSEPETGTVALQPNGDFTYTPPANFEGGLITFTYFATSSNAPNAPSLETTVNLNYVALIVTPVNFISFNAKKVSGGTQLTWDVADEYDVARYEVEKNSGNGFQKIGEVAASKNPSYSFTDAQVSAGPVQYRVRNIDIDGQFKYTNIVSFKNGVASVVLKAFPLPVAGSVTVQHAAANNGRISIASANGQIVKTVVHEKGSVQTELDLGGLKAGMYLLRFDAGDGTIETIKLIKQ